MSEQDPKGEDQWKSWGETREMDDDLLKQMNALNKRAKACMPIATSELYVRKETRAHIRNHFQQAMPTKASGGRIYELLRYPLLAAASISLFFLFMFGQEDPSGSTTPGMKSTFADTVHSLHQSLNPQEDSIRDQLLLDVN